MEAISNSVAALEVSAGQDGLRIELHRLADRYAHQIWRIERSVRAELLLQSQEGVGAPDADCLPALQALNIERLPSGDQAAALIGMSGANHWSLTIEPGLRSGRPAILFDAACRIRNAPPELKSRYLLESALEVQGDQQQISLTSPQGCRVEIGVCSSESVPDARLAYSDRQLDVIRAVAAGDPKGRTVRWQYAITLSAT